MRGLSGDIEESIDIVLEGLNFDISIGDIDPDKMSRTMNSKKDSFIEAKILLNEWVSSANRPSDAKIMSYAKKLVRAGDYSIIKLRKALKLKIDYKTLAPEKHGSAIKAKTTILKTIRMINTSLAELRIQISSNDVKFKEENYKVGFPERFADGNFYPERDYFKQWHDKDTDSVMICPIGTKGEIINIDGLNVMLPKIPFKKYILFSDKKKEDQYWRREKIPRELTPKSVDSFTTWILE
ncbi:hypothetical protein LCGC14_2968660, partial [marine sediment metagenome]